MGGRSHSHYDDTRYYALNLHAVLIRERWNGGVLTVPSMQEKYVQISPLALAIFCSSYQSEMYPYEKDGDF